MGERGLDARHGRIELEGDLVEGSRILLEVVERENGRRMRQTVLLQARVEARRGRAEVRYAGRGGDARARHHDHVLGSTPQALGNGVQVHLLLATTTTLAVVKSRTNATQRSGDQTSQEVARRADRVEHSLRAFCSCNVVVIANAGDVTINT